MAKASCVFKNNRHNKPYIAVRKLLENAVNKSFKTSSFLILPLIKTLLHTFYLRKVLQKEIFKKVLYNLLIWLANYFFQGFLSITYKKYE